MKKIFLLFTVLVLLNIQSVSAQTVPVQALEDLSTENPPHTFSLIVLENVYLKDQTILFNGGDILEGQIVDVKNSKRLKRDAGFKFVPVTCKSIEGSVSGVKGYYPAKFTTKVDRGGIAKSAALGVGNYFVKGLSMGYTALEGAVKNEKSNRFISSVNSLYESSPLSLVEKGHEIFIKKDQTFLLNFKIKETEDNLPNYEYEELDAKEAPDET